MLMLFDTRLGGGGEDDVAAAEGEEEEGAPAPDDWRVDGSAAFLLGFRVLPSPFPMSSAKA
jgi:hypothetical protein